MTEATPGPTTAETPEPADEVVEDVVNQIAHDIRNFAFAIGLQAELGARRAFDPAASKSHSVAVLRQVDMLKGYLERLLMFGRPFRPQPGPLDPVDLLRETAQLVGASVVPEGPTPAIQVVVQGSIGRVVWDRRGIHAALAALLDNALRSAPSPPPVRAIVEEAGEHVRITVRDEGSGMDAATLAALRHPMVVRRPGGAGLGLAVARKVVRAHGGTLTIASGAGGTSVCLEIPREARGEG